MTRGVITGAAGNIGAKLAQGLRGRHKLVLLDRRGGEGIIQADLSKPDNRWEQFFSGADFLVHLAGNADEKAPWKDLLGDNIHALLHVLHASVGSGLKRLIFASSCHTMGRYWNGPATGLITPDMAPAPDSDYGASKVVGEEICRNFSLRYGLSAICLRIGWVPRHGGPPGEGASFWQRSVWLAPADLIQLVSKAIEAEDVDFGVFFATSDLIPGIWDLTPTKRVLGYVPGGR